MSARPFQLGDRVRITHHWTDGDEVHEGVARWINPVKGHPDAMNLTIWTDEPFAQDDGNLVQNDSVTLTLDCTAARWSHASIELLEAATEDQDDDVDPSTAGYGDVGIEAETRGDLDHDDPDEPIGNAVYECTECQYVSVCGAGASNEDYDDWRQDGYEHDEMHRERDDDARAAAAVALPVGMAPGNVLDVVDGRFTIVPAQPAPMAQNSFAGLAAWRFAQVS